MDLKDIRAELARGARVFKAFDQCEAFLLELERIEQRNAEAQSRFDAVPALEAELAAKTAESIAAIENNHQVAADLIKAANDKAEEIKNDALNKADQTRVALSAEKALHDTKTKELNTSLKAAGFCLEELNKQIGEAQSRLDEINEQKKKALDALGA